MFIAFEAERILSEAFDCEVEICRRDRLSAALAESAFDIVILEFVGHEREDRHYVFLVRQAGAQPVFLTATDDHWGMSEVFPDVPTIRKPFNDTEVRAIIGDLLVSRGKDVHRGSPDTLAPL
ncbi:hypothetical protein ABID16_003178 [Rhizobium aquaticum]|uniref:Response regulatory domain-containing protein n=1 Tax=Rhizobium aquaticum TaxID=1549636 RepID=A0ABV2J251_9HYPH